MELKDWLPAVIGFISALVVAKVVFQLNRENQRRQSIRELFFGLKKHVDEFQFAMYNLLAHSLHHDIVTREIERFENWGKRTPKPPGYEEQKAAAAEKWDKLNKESIESAIQTRNARTALNANKFLLKGYYSWDECKELVEILNKFTDMSEQFLSKQGGGRTPEYSTVKELPIDTTAEEAHEAIETLWASTIFPPSIGDY